jgi:hypothetical protein
MLNLYHLAHTLRTGLGGPRDLEEAEQKFLAARTRLLAEGGGVVSIYYHPCEFVHKEFWDAANFRGGANPPRSRWKLPAQKTPEESRTAYLSFMGYIRFIKRFPEVRFVTATEALQVYRDKARGRKFTPAELKAVAARVGPDVTFQRQDDYALAASEVFALLNEYVAGRTAGRDVPAVELKGTPWGPSNPVPELREPVTTEWDQFTRTAADVEEFMARHGRVPTTVWLGSMPVPPEAYLRSLAKVTKDLVDGKPPGETIEVRPAKLAAAGYVTADAPNLWGWVIFPKGFRAPAMMELAKRQAWTLKPAIPGKEG